MHSYININDRDNHTCIYRHIKAHCYSDMHCYVKINARHKHTYGHIEAHCYSDMHCYVNILMTQSLGGYKWTWVYLHGNGYSCIETPSDMLPSVYLRQSIYQRLAA